MENFKLFISDGLPILINWASSFLILWLSGSLFNTHSNLNAISDHWSDAACNESVIRCSTKPPALCSFLNSFDKIYTIYNPSYKILYVALHSVFNTILSLFVGCTPSLNQLK